MVMMDCEQNGVCGLIFFFPKRGALALLQKTSKARMLTNILSRSVTADTAFNSGWFCVFCGLQQSWNVKCIAQTWKAPPVV